MFLQRVTESDIRMSIRPSGFAAVEDVAAVVLETDGSLSVRLNDCFGGCAVGDR
ncbi:MAG: YetF domain-containing protein [Acidobacteriota bacterium]